MQLHLRLVELKALSRNRRVEPHESDDGVIYGYNVYFEEGSDPEELDKIEGLVDRCWIRIGP